MMYLCDAKNLKYFKTGAVKLNFENKQLSKHRILKAIEVLFYEKTIILNVPVTDGGGGGSRPDKKHYREG